MGVRVAMKAFDDSETYVGFMVYYFYSNLLICSIMHFYDYTEKISWKDYSNAASNSRKTRLESTRHFGVATASFWHTEYVNCHVIGQKSQSVVYATLT